ncbi:ATP synthase subunit delta, mitochondrial, partial [Trachymyrmex cornetzi]
CAEMSNLARTLRPFLKCVRSQSHQRRTYADAADQMKFTFAGANQVFYDRAVIRQVDVPSFSGSFGILPKHVPTLAVLKPGVITIYEEDGSSKKIFVSSGTIAINEDNSVQILAEEAHPVENLDNSAARDILNKAQQQLSSATSDVDKAEAGIAVEVAEALVQATQ